jgi:hypothetical protein
MGWTGAKIPNMPNGGSYATYDPSISHNGNPSIQVIGGIYAPNLAGEVDGAWIPVSPGDHIVLSIWVKTSTSTSTDPSSGSFFGFDFYGQSNRGYGILGDSPTNSAGQPTGTEIQWGNPTAWGYTINGANGLKQVSGLICKIPFGVSTWTQEQFDFIVPSQTWNYVNNQPCNPTQIDGMIPWLGVHSNDGNGKIWFSDPVLFNLG